MLFQVFSPLAPTRDQQYIRSIALLVLVVGVQLQSNLSEGQTAVEQDII